MVSSHIPFVVNVSKSTFEELDQLLAEVSEGLLMKSDWPPSQDKECMAVATLNLLNLQVISYSNFVLLPDCSWLSRRLSHTM